jgi:cysteine desulfurase
VIYLDHHAATPLSAGVPDAMAAALATGWANPSSVHKAGRQARASLERSRQLLAESVHAKSADLVLTSGGSEACNLALLGLAEGRPGRTLVTSAIEHPAFAEIAFRWQQAGAKVVRLPVPAGVPFSPSALADCIDENTVCALQWVNHETGTVLPIPDYARACAAKQALLAVDACQAIGKIACNFEQIGASAIAFAASKVGGPSGAGAVWINRELLIASQVLGGGQERGRRAGTPDVAAHAGFAAAVSHVTARVEAQQQIASLRNELEHACVQLGGVVNGATGPRVATVTNVSFPGWRGDVLVAALDVEGLCASSGAACSSGVGAPSPVLLAMYPDEPWRASSALRLSLGPETGPADVQGALAILKRVLGRGPRA